MAMCKTRSSVSVTKHKSDNRIENTKKRLSTLAAKHDMIVLILDDPDEFRVRSRLGYIRISDMETGKQTVVSARKAGAIRRRIEESRESLQYKLKYQAGIDSVVLTPDNHIEELPKFLISRTAR